MGKIVKKIAIKAVLFDLDGTLIDTEPSAARAIAECFAKWGVAIDASDATTITGRTWDTAWQYLFKKYEIPVPTQQASREMIARYRELIEADLLPVKGSTEAVRALAREFPLALVSGSYRSEILWALEKLGIQDLFQVILGAEDYPRSKPEPDGYLKAIDLLNTRPESVLVFEDSEPGIASAKTAGAHVVAITGTNHFHQNTSQADALIADLTGVSPAWIRAFSQKK